MATKKISQLIDGSSAQGGDQLPVARSGATRRITVDYIKSYIQSAFASVFAPVALGLVARYTVGSDITFTNNQVKVVNFDTLGYDPGATVTTGASWVFTCPTTGHYDIRLQNAFVDPNGAAWGNPTFLRMDVRKNGSTVGTIDYREFEGTTSTDLSQFLRGTFGISLTAGDTIALRMTNASSGTRLLGASSQIEIHRTK
jgi:hypothetical protein